MQIVGGRGLKTEPQIETPRMLVDGVGDQCPCAGVLGDGRKAQHRVLQKRDPQALALVDLVNSEAGQDHDRDRTALRLAFEQALSRMGRLSFPYRQGKVADHLGSILGGHEDPS